MINQIDRWLWSLVLFVVGFFAPHAGTADVEQALCDAAGAVAYSAGLRVCVLPLA